MAGNVFIVNGDIARCQADAVIFSTSTALEGSGEMQSSFRRLAGFDAWYAELGGQPKRKVGDTDWLPPRSSPRQPGVVLVRSVSSAMPASLAAQAAAVLEQALRRAVDELQAAGNGGPWLVLAPALLAGQGGGHWQRLDIARACVGAARAFVEREPRLDVAFVLFTPSSTSLYRHARRGLNLAPTDASLAALPDLTRSIGAGECALFVGSGVSAAAGLPTWDALIRRMAEVAGIDCSTELPYEEKLQIAATFRSRRADGLRPVAEVVSEVFGRTPAPVLTHYLLAQLGCRYLFTTNYDRLLEETLTMTKRPWGRVAHARDVPTTSRVDVAHVIKLHGDAAAPDEPRSADVYGDVVLSSSDYDRFSRDRAAFDLLLSGLMLNHTFLFVGYSLADQNVRDTWRRILASINLQTRGAGYARRAYGLGYRGGELEVEGLDWIPNAGQDEPARRRAQWCRLDALAEYAPEPAQLLAPGGEPAAELRPLQQPLDAAAAGLLDVLVAETALPAAVTATMRRVAGLLYDLGWRHDTNTRSLWELLAIASRSRHDETCELLELARAYAPSRDEAVRIDEWLATVR